MKENQARLAALADEVADLKKRIPGGASNLNPDRRLRTAYAQQLIDENDAKVVEPNTLLAEVEVAVASISSPPPPPKP